MPEDAPAPPAPQVLPPAETVTVTAPAPPAPAPVDPPAPDLPVEPAPPPGEQLDGEVLRDLIDGIDGMNALMEGGEAAGAGGPLLLDPAQFAALGLGLALVVALLAAVLVVGLRR